MSLLPPLSGRVRIGRRGLATLSSALLGLQSKPLAERLQACCRGTALVKFNLRDGKSRLRHVQ